MMKRFLQDERGNAVVWSAFLVLILFTLSFVVYGAVTIYSKYQNCETELERTAIVAVDQSMSNPKVRDMQLDIPATPALAALEQSLTGMGWAKENGSWVMRANGKNLYRLDGLVATADGRRLRITADCVMSLPWEIGGLKEVSIPIRAQTSILTID